MFTVGPLEDTIVAGKYQFKEGDRLTVLLPAMHRDPKVWGPDPEEFRPERMAPELWAKLPPNSCKPLKRLKVLNQYSKLIVEDVLVGLLHGKKLQ